VSGARAGEARRYFRGATVGRYATRDEVRAALAGVDAGVAATLAAFAAASGRSVEEVAWAQVAFVPRCVWCGAVGDGVWGHRTVCRVYVEWRYGFERSGWRRREAAGGGARDDFDVF
jgi:hypothetical protein